MQARLIMQTQIDDPDASSEEATCSTLIVPFPLDIPDDKQEALTEILVDVAAAFTEGCRKLTGLSIEAYRAKVADLFETLRQQNVADTEAVIALPDQTGPTEDVVAFAAAAEQDPRLKALDIRSTKAQ